MYDTQGMKSKNLIKLLTDAGWELKRVKESHHQFCHNDYSYTVTVPHPKKDLGKGLVRAILKQAKLKYQ